MLFKSQLRKSGTRRAGKASLRLKEKGYQRENRGVAAAYNFHLFIIRFRDTTSSTI
jgi:hypothetical protein